MSSVARWAFVLILPLLVFIGQSFVFQYFGIETAPLTWVKDFYKQVETNKKFADAKPVEQLLLSGEGGVPQSYPQNIADIPTEIRDAYEKSGAAFVSLAYCQNGTGQVYVIDNNNLLYGNQTYYSRTGRKLGENGGSYEWNSITTNIDTRGFSCTNLANKTSEAVKRRETEYRDKELNEYKSPNFWFSFRRPTTTDYVLVSNNLMQFDVFPGLATSSYVRIPKATLSIMQTEGKIDINSWIKQQKGVITETIRPVRSTPHRKFTPSHTYHFVTQTPERTEHFAFIVKELIYSISGPLASGQDENPDVELVLSQLHTSEGTSDVNAYLGMTVSPDPDYKGMIAEVTPNITTTVTLMNNIKSVVEFAAQVEGAGKHQVKIIALEKRDWPPGCLFGKGGKGPTCPQTIQPGYLITLSVAGKESKWRIGEDSRSGSVKEQ